MAKEPNTVQVGGRASESIFGLSATFVRITSGLGTEIVWLPQNVLLCEIHSAILNAADRPV